MTTIAYDGKCIACDGRVTYRNSIMTDDANKMYVNSTGDKFFLSGDSSECERFVNIFEHKKEIYFDIGVSGLMVDSKNDVYSVGYSAKENKWEFWKLKINGQIFADGSGTDHALTAMDIGKTAKEAVYWATKRDIYSGGLIRVYDVKKAKFINV